MLSDAAATRALADAEAELARGEGEDEATLAEAMRARRASARVTRDTSCSSLPPFVGCSRSSCLPPWPSPHTSSSSAHSSRTRTGSASRCVAQFEGCHSARRGTYRVIYRIDDAKRRVTVIGVMPRSDVYRRTEARSFAPRTPAPNPPLPGGRIESRNRAEMPSAASALGSGNCANMCSCRTRRPSCTPTSTPSTRPSSSATTVGCAAARSSSAAASCSPPATRPRRAGCAPRWAAGRPGGCARTPSSSSPGWPPTPKRAGPCSRCSSDTTPLVEGLSIDEAFLDVGGLRRSRARRPRSRCGCGADVAEQVGLPITVGVARTKFLAKVASGVAKPDGLLVVPPEGELAFLHPLPVERLWGVGAVDGGEAARPGHHHRRRHRRASPEGALVAMLGTGVRPAHPRPRPQPRPAAGTGRPAPAIDRLTAGARTRAALAGRASTPWWWRWSTG